MTTTPLATFLASEHETAFSFEILPPLRGRSIDETFKNIDTLAQFSPAYINITTHRQQIEYRETSDGSFRVVTSQRRPGTVAIAAAIRERYHVPAVPHLICGEYTRQEIENQLIDLSYLGITEVLALRGDRGMGQKLFTAQGDGHEHALGLCQQITDFNHGIMADGSQTEAVVPPVSFGVAGYPEKHDEAMNLQMDIEALKRKIEAGAGYVVTQMFFDNEKYFSFVAKCREQGITVPIIPGLKPLTSLTQKALLPRTFHIDLPHPLAQELERCSDNAQVKTLGVEWATYQARELKAAGVPSIHFYSMNATASVAQVAKNVY